MPFEILQSHVDNGLIRKEVVDQINSSRETELSISGISLDQLPSFVKIEILTIHNCNIVEIPVMPKLKVLSVESSDDLYRIYSSPKLEVLNLIDCRNFQNFPDVDLKYLKIDNNDVIKRIPRYSSLVSLDLKYMNLYETPPLDSLVMMRLTSTMLEKIPICKNLKFLFINVLNITKKIPSMPKLEVLTIQDMNF